MYRARREMFREYLAGDRCLIPASNFDAFSARRRMSGAGSFGCVRWGEPGWGETPAQITFCSLRGLETGAKSA